jgi:hypothetical protein
MCTLANCHNVAGRFSEAERTARTVLDGLPRPRSDWRSQALAARAHHDLAVALLGPDRTIPTPLPGVNDSAAWTSDSRCPGVGFSITDRPFELYAGSRSSFIVD